MDRVLFGRLKWKLLWSSLVERGVDWLVGLYQLASGPDPFLPLLPLLLFVLAFALV